MLCLFNYLLLYLLLLSFGVLVLISFCLRVLLVGLVVLILVAEFVCYVLGGLVCVMWLFVFAFGLYLIGLLFLF